MVEELHKLGEGQSALRDTWIGGRLTSSSSVGMLAAVLSEVEAE